MRWRIVCGSCCAITGMFDESLRLHASLCIRVATPHRRLGPPHATPAVAPLVKVNAQTKKKARRKKGGIQDTLFDAKLRQGRP
jgi:hypothetical protein